MGEIFERAVPNKPLEWTGERLTSATVGQVEIEHLHRYFVARTLCRGLDVLDVAAGEGYGAALLAQVARSVVGVEISAEAVAHATEAYQGQNLRFLKGDARCLSLDDDSVDVVVSFETIEHFYEHNQFLAEVRRVLRPGGRFIVSSPERDVYSPSGSAANPYHVRELSRTEFSALLQNSFSHVHLLGQRPILGSILVSDDREVGRTLTFEKRGQHHFEGSVGLPRPVYLLAVASDTPVNDVPDSCYIETAEVGTILATANAAESAVAELSTLRGNVNAAESALLSARNELALSIQQANEQAATYRQQLLVADQASHDHAARARVLESELAELRTQLSEAASYRQQLLVADQASHDHAARASVLESELAELRTQLSEAAAAYTQRDMALSELKAASMQRDIARVAIRRAAAAEKHWRDRVAELEQRAAEWQNRYFGLRSRLEAILRRFWILRISQMVPASVRRFVRERLLGGVRK